MKKLLTQILIELAHTPLDYKQPIASLRGAVRLSLAPSPSDAEIAAALLRAEVDGFILRDDCPLQGARYLITSLGRELVRGLGY